MLPVTKIQHFCTKDGPGIRTTVFLKGCPLRCIWCHNLETQSMADQFFYAEHLCIRCGICEAACPSRVHHITDSGHCLERSKCTGCMKCTDACPTGALERCSKQLSAEEIFRSVMKDAAFYNGIGGVTFSGGEPTVHAELLIPLLRLFRSQAVSTAIETCGYFDAAILPELTAVTDWFLWDVKDTDDRRHLANTGVPSHKIISNLKKADACGAKTILRCILLKAVNLNTEHLQNIAAIYNSLKHCKGVELIPYHTYGGAKQVQLGQNETVHPEWIPSSDDIYNAEVYLRQYAPIIHN